jgi:acetyl-CoA carboxylase carboxyl transferase subunit beta
MVWERFRKRKDSTPHLWLKCEDCGEIIYKKNVEEKMKVCPECNYHFRISASERLGITLDEGSFTEHFADVMPANPLGFFDKKSYARRLEEAQKSTGLNEAIVTGTGSVDGREVAMGVMDANFIMASMGSVVGEKVARLAELACERGLPLVIFSAGGGARMQEGVLSLAQMAKTSAAIARFHDAGGLYISVMTNPTTGGVAASFASLGDVTIAEPKAMIGFAGARVIKHTLKLEVPEGFQTAEFLMEHGLVDMVVNRSEMKTTLASLIDYLAPAETRPAAQPRRKRAAGGEEEKVEEEAESPRRRPVHKVEHVH